MLDSRRRRTPGRETEKPAPGVNSKTEDISIDYFGDCRLLPEFVFEPVVGEEGKVFEVNSVVA